MVTAVKRIGFMLIIVGLASICFYNIYLRYLNNKAIDDAVNYIDETSNVIKEEHENEEIEPVKDAKEETSQIKYTAVIEIPKINLKRGVVNNTKGFKSISYAISVDNNSNYPNENGNFILYSHSGNSSISFFDKLYRLESNDDIYVYYDGIKYHYKIIKKYDIKKTGKAKVINRKDDKYITLITCNQDRKGYQIVLIGKQIDQIKY